LKKKFAKNYTVLGREELVSKKTKQDKRVRPREKGGFDKKEKKETGE